MAHPRRPANTTICPDSRAHQRWRPTGWLRAASVCMALVAALAGGVAPAHADQAVLFTSWGGHGQGMQLKPDGTGTLSESSGAANNEQWGLTWSGDPTQSVTVTLASLTSRTGDGVGFRQGQQFTAHVGQSRGDTVLYTTLGSGSDPSDMFCTAHDYQTEDPSQCGQ